MFFIFMIPSFGNIHLCISFLFNCGLTFPVGSLVCDLLFDLYIKIDFGMYVIMILALGHDMKSQILQKSQCENFI